MEPGTLASKTLLIEGKRAVLGSPTPMALLSAASKMEGHKAWLKNGGGFSFEPTHHNLRLFKEALPDVAIDDRREDYAAFEKATTDTENLVGGGSSGVAGYNPTGRPTYTPRTPPFGVFQTDAVSHCLKHDYSALLMEQGTGKSWVALTVAGTRWSAGQIEAMIVVAFNGVHEQWCEEAIPDHLGEMVPRRCWAYKSGKRMPEWLIKRDGTLNILAINFESVHTAAGRTTMERFINAHAGRVISVVDESQRIKNPEAKSSVEIVELGHYCRYRMILTGTPIAKDLTDMWAQFKYMDDSIFGHEYKSTFRAQFCVMGGPGRRLVVAAKNEERFYEIASPYCYRVTKSEVLDLPDKIYDKWSFELHPEQRRIYDDLKRKFVAELESGEVVTIKHALTLVTRLQQVTCGYIALDKERPDDATEYKRLPWNPRLDALKQVRKSRMGKMVIWARFTKDIEDILETYRDSSVSYYGGTGRDERIENKQRYIDDDNITEFCSNPSAGGTGVDGLQKVTRTAVYYSNSYNSIHRWQSEDRTHRIGMTGTCTYIDLVARDTVDGPILRNLRKKKELSDLVLDDIRMVLLGDTTNETDR